MPVADRTSDREWSRNWTVLVAAVAGTMLSTVHGYSLQVMIAPLEKEYGWSRAGIASGMLILAMMALFAAPAVGVAVDRYGPRRIGLAGVTACCVSLALLATATSNIATWLGLWVIMSASAMLVAPTVWTAAVSSYFVKNRGFALAITLCGTGLGGAFVPMITNALVDRFGWRGGYAGLGIVFGIIVLPLTFFLFRSAADDHREGRSAERAQPAAVLPGMTRSEGLRSPTFLKLAAAAFLAGIAACALTANAVPILISQGLSHDVAASIVGVIGIGAIVGRLTGGYLLDRLDAKKVAAACVAMPIITVAILIAKPGSASAALTAFIILGLAIGTELDAGAYLAARHFGMKSFGTLFGTINGLLLFASGATPILCGHVYDVTKSYVPVLWALMPLSLIASLLFLVLGTYKRFETSEELVLATV